MVRSGETALTEALVARRLMSDHVLPVLTDLFVERGLPGRSRSDKGPESVAKVVHGGLGQVAVTTLGIALRRGPIQPAEQRHTAQTATRASPRPSRQALPSP